MFSSSKKQPQGSGLLSLISPDTTIEGKLSCSGEIQIDGTVIGDVVAGKLVLGESGRIEGSIQTERLDVRGTIKGNIFSDEVNLRSSANVNGDIVQARSVSSQGRYCRATFPDCRNFSRKVTLRISVRWFSSSPDNGIPSQIKKNKAAFGLAALLCIAVANGISSAIEV